MKKVEYSVLIPEYAKPSVEELVEEVIRLVDGDKLEKSEAFGRARYKFEADEDAEKVFHLLAGLNIIILEK